MKLFLTFGFYILFTFLVFSQVHKERNAVLNVLENQRTAWNNGNLEEYMEGYWNSDSLRFVGKNGVRYGWNETLAAYKKGYPSKKEMGYLSFNVISLEFLSENSAYMIGRWNLIRYENNISGHFLLIWKKINNNWRVIADHSS